MCFTLWLQKSLLEPTSQAEPLSLTLGTHAFQDRFHMLLTHFGLTQHWRPPAGDPILFYLRLPRLGKSAGVWGHWRKMKALAYSPVCIDYLSISGVWAGTSSYASPMHRLEAHIGRLSHWGPAFCT